MSSEGAPADDRQAIPFVARFIATGFFSGYIPWASGTFGTLVGALFFFIPFFTHPLVLTSAIIVGLVAGAYTSARVAAVVGHRLTRMAHFAKQTFQNGTHTSPDPSIVVVDEMVGMWIAMFALYPSSPHPPLVAVAVAFVCFRLFDIVKPYPARQVERYGAGWGIMLDDVVAGIYANMCSRLLLALLFSFFPSLF